jgi:hypothetical protein
MTGKPADHFLVGADLVGFAAFSPVATTGLMRSMVL